MEVDDFEVLGSDNHDAPPPIPPDSNESIYDLVSHSMRDTAATHLKHMQQYSSCLVPHEINRPLQLVVASRGWQGVEIS
jgi:hypothetical protein